MSKFTIPLYHGTDRKLLSLSKEQREAAKASAFNLIHYFADIYVKNEFEFKDYHISASDKKEKHNAELKEKLGDYHKSTWDAYSVACSINKPNYQYNSLYLTGDYQKASRYAYGSNLFGEIGSVAYRLMHGAKLMEYEIDSKFIETELLILNPIWEITPNPILIQFDNLDRKDLLTERGEEVDDDGSSDDFLKPLSFRLKRELESLSDYKIITLPSGENK